MKRGGAAPLAGLGLAAAAIVVVVALSTHGFQHDTGCAAYSVVPAVTVKIVGDASMVGAVQVCARNEECATAPRSGDATPDTGPAPAASLTGSGAATNATFIPSFLSSASDRPQVWVFDVGPGEPAAVTVTATETSGKVLARRTFPLSWHSSDSGDGCNHGNITDPVCLRLQE